MAGLTLSTVERRWIGLLPVAVFLVSSALLLSWWSALAAAQHRSMQEHFEADARRVEIKISERLDAHDEILRGVAGELFAASKEVSREDFRRYVEELHLGRTYGESRAWVSCSGCLPGPWESTALGPGGGAPRLRGTARRAPRPLHEHPLPRALLGGGTFGPSGATSSRSPASRRHGVRPGPGAAGHERHVTLSRSPIRRAGRSAPVLDPSSWEGVIPGAGRLATRPWGWVYSPMRMNDVMQRILSRDLPTFRLLVFDGGETGTDHLLYDSHPGGRPPPRIFPLPAAPVEPESWTLRFTAGGPTWRGSGSARPSEFALMTLISFLLPGCRPRRGSRRARLRGGTCPITPGDEARYRPTFERAPVGIFTVDAQDRFLQLNQRYCQITVFARRRVRRNEPHGIVHRDYRAVDAEPVRGPLPEERIGTLERRAGPRTHDLLGRGHLLLMRRPGGARRLIGVLDDITARHEAEAKFREIAERSVAGILILQDDRVVYANPLAGEIGRPLRRPGPPRGSRGARTRPPGRPAGGAGRGGRGAPTGDRLPPALAYRVARKEGARKVERPARKSSTWDAPPCWSPSSTSPSGSGSWTSSARPSGSSRSASSPAASPTTSTTCSPRSSARSNWRRAPPARAPAAPELDLTLSRSPHPRPHPPAPHLRHGRRPSRKLLRFPGSSRTRLGWGWGSSAGPLRARRRPAAIEADEGQISQLWDNLLVNARQALGGEARVSGPAGGWCARGSSPGSPPGPVEIAIEDPGHGIPAKPCPGSSTPSSPPVRPGPGSGSPSPTPSCGATADTSESRRGRARAPPSPCSCPPPVDPGGREAPARRSKGAGAAAGAPHGRRRAGAQGRGEALRRLGLEIEADAAGDGAVE